MKGKIKGANSRLMRSMLRNRRKEREENVKFEGWRMTKHKVDGSNGKEDATQNTELDDNVTDKGTKPQPNSCSEEVQLKNESENGNKAMEKWQSTKVSKRIASETPGDLSRWDVGRRRERTCNESRHVFDGMKGRVYHARKGIERIEMESHDEEMSEVKMKHKVYARSSGEDNDTTKMCTIPESRRNEKNKYHATSGEGQSIMPKGQRTGDVTGNTRSTNAPSTEGRLNTMEARGAQGQEHGTDSAREAMSNKSPAKTEKTKVSMGHVKIQPWGNGHEVTERAEYDTRMQKMMQQIRRKVVRRVVQRAQRTSIMPLVAREHETKRIRQVAHRTKVDGLS
ncbi:hypothetical protein K438DRAFT_1752430 [Mycena galopus ATCC 62051]|nr:hypothetical protein K438DRAFT_1752430 [Mycena galopus ATCC 62051]